MRSESMGQVFLIVWPKCLKFHFGPMHLLQMGKPDYDKVPALLTIHIVYLPLQLCEKGKQSHVAKQFIIFLDFFGMLFCKQG